VYPDATPNLGASIMRARVNLDRLWPEIADRYTVGWGAPAEAVEGAYSFISEGITTIRSRLMRELPLFLFHDRANPPTKAAVAIPYVHPSGELYTCKLLADYQLVPDEPRLLSDFSQAVWFLIGNGALPSPAQGEAFARTLESWTGIAASFISEAAGGEGNGLLLLVET
jgi:hypothetical protein